MKIHILTVISSMLPLALSNPVGPNLAIDEWTATRQGLNDALNIFEEQLRLLNWPNPHHNSPEFHQLDKVDVLPARLGESQKIAVGLVGKLLAMLELPHKKVMQGSLSHHISAGLQVMTYGGVVDILTKEPFSAQGFNAEALSEPKRMDPDVLTRILRMMANAGYLRETTEGYFAANRVTMALANEKKPGIMQFVKYQSKMSLEESVKIAEHLFDPKTRENHDPAWTPFARAFPKEKNLWTYMALHPEDAANFFPAMEGFGSISAPAVIQDFAWSELGEFTLIDVGSGSGAFGKPLLDADPKIANAILQDNNQQGLNIAKGQHWRKDALVKFMLHDYLQPEPQSIKDIERKVFLMRYIIHDLHDERALIALEHIRDSMRADDRLIIIDYLVIPATTAENHQSVKDAMAIVQDSPKPFRGVSAVYPLPQSFGEPAILASMVDVEMFAAINALERTQKQWEELLTKADFDFTINVNRGKDAVIECRLKSTTRPAPIGQSAPPAPAAFQPFHLPTSIS